MLAPPGYPLGRTIIGRARRRGLSDRDACWYHRDTTARVVRCADSRRGRGRPFDCRHCRRGKRGLAGADEIGIRVIVELVVEDECVADGISLAGEIDDRFVGHVLDDLVEQNTIEHVIGKRQRFADADAEAVDAVARSFFAAATGS